MRYAYWREEGQASPSLNPEDDAHSISEGAGALWWTDWRRFWPLAGIGAAGALTVAAAIAVGLPERTAGEATDASSAQTAVDIPAEAASPAEEPEVAATPSGETKGLVEPAPNTQQAEAETETDTLRMRMAGEAPAEASNRAERPDLQQTASIDDADGLVMEDVVAVAESETELLALEDEQRRQNAELLSEVEGTQLAYSSPVDLDVESAGVESAGIESAGVESAGPIGEGTAGTAPLEPAQVTQFVNFRAGPANEEAVIAVIPEGTRIEATTECQHWCEALYQGRRGYVYESYVVPVEAAAVAPTEAIAAQP